MTKEKTLKILTALSKKRAGLGLGFHPFGDNTQLQRQGKINDGFDDGSIVMVMRKAPDIAAIDFDLTDRQMS